MMESAKSVFSSREVFMMPGNVTVVNLRIPVVEGLKVLLQDGKQAAVNFLPPIEIRLLPSDSPDYAHQAHISCSWLKFKELRRVGAILDNTWNPEVSLNVNLEMLLHDLVLMLPIKLKLHQELDLTWRATTKNPARSENLAVDVAVPLLRRSPKSRKPKHLLVKTVTFHRKSFDIGEIVKTYDEEERAFGSIPGDSFVTCPVGTICNNEVLTTRAFRSKLCGENFHIICYRCLIDMLEKATCLPTCIEYQCLVQYPSWEMCSLVKGLKLFNKVSDWSAAQSLSETVRELSMNQCPWCAAKVFPVFYVKEYGITLCKICDNCFCEKCLKHPEDAPHLRCDVMRGKELYYSEGTPQFTVLLDQYSNDWLLEIKTAWEYQNMKVHDEQCCPRCFLDITQEDGCDHMECPKCSEHFCYTCGYALPIKNPYKHFDPDGNCLNIDYYL